MAKEHNIPSYVHTNMALLALQRAMSGIRLIEGEGISISEYRDCLPAIFDELNKVAYYLSSLKNRSTPTPMFLNN
jgi:hypothetical protein